MIANLVAANTNRFRLLKSYKAVPGKDENVAIFESAQITTLTQKWTGPLKYTTIPRKQSILNMNNLQSQDTANHYKIPDATDRDTVLNLAKMTLDAYYEINDPAWLPVPGWDVSTKFGWNNGGIRGYLFESESKEDLVIVIKGTSLATPLGSGPTAKLDKLNVFNILTKG